MTIRVSASLLGLASALVLYFYNSQAHAANYTTCIRWEVQTIDSGNTVAAGPAAGVTEDYWTNADSQIWTQASGVRVKISRGTWETTLDANSIGCVSWSSSDTSGFSVRVYGYSTDAHDNFVRIHNSTSTTCPSYPGGTYSMLVTNYTPTPSSSDYLTVGSGDRKWTAMAALAFGLSRVHDGLYNKAIHAGLKTGTTSGDCGGSTAHAGSLNGEITNDRHCLIIGACDPSAGTPQAQSKFVVAHELGHALGALYYGGYASAVDGDEPGISYAGSNPTMSNPNTVCTDSGNFYEFGSREWNSVGFREGWAHFISASVWNSKAQQCAYTWTGTHSCEHWSGATNGGGITSGGRLENWCCPSGACGSSLAGFATNLDWLNFFWEWYTQSVASCPYSPDMEDMMQVYANTRINGGLNASNYFTKMRTGASWLPLNSCLTGARFDFYASWHGIDN